MPDFLGDGGEMGALMRAKDWSKSSLGPPEKWPQTLRTVVRLMLNTGHPMYIWWGEDGACLYNDAYRQSIGPERHPGSLGRPAREVWAEIWDVIGPQIDQVMQGRGATWHENQLVPITRHGRRDDVYWTYSYSPIDDETAAHGVGGVLVVCTETTQQVRASQQLVAERDRLAGLFEQAPSFIAMLSGPEHKIELANPAYMKLVGHRPVLGKTVAEALPDAVAQGYLDLLDKVFASGQAYSATGAKYTVQPAPNGPTVERFVDFVYQPIVDTTGKVDGVFVEGVDITERKHAEAALQALNATLERRIEESAAELRANRTLTQTLFEHSSECYAVLVEGQEGEFWYEEINPATLRLYNRTRDQVIGRTTKEVLGVERATEVNRHMAACLRSAGAYTYERRQEDGVVEAIAMPLPSKQGMARRVFVSARDVSERRRLEEQLRQAQKMEAVGQLTGGVAHDFNNLLTLILGGLDLIGRQIPQLQSSDASAKVVRARDMALQGVTRAAALTSRLLAFSRQQALTPQALDANKLVAGICDLLRRTIGEAVSLETVLAGGLWPTFADSNQLENALINLALNARDAMPNGGKLTIETANAHLDHAYVQSVSEPVLPGQYVMIAVADTGGGMDLATRERAFDPFFTTKEVGKGTGLGLSQVYGFARQSAGHVKIYSELGEGTTVKIYLPRRLDATEEARPLHAPDATQSVGTETIMVVEDDDALRAYTSDVLLELGYRVLNAANGATALELLGGEEHVDLLLTDVVMPGGVNGRQLADEAVHRRPQLKVLFMTGYTRNAIVHHGRLDAGIHMIGKPFSLEELAARVRSRLDGSQ
jgi:PAS domain S-box-containing protein